MNRRDQFTGGAVGKGGPKTDGAAKITGQAIFTDDLHPQTAHSLGFEIPTRPRLDLNHQH